MNTLLAQLLNHGLAAVSAASLIESLGAPVPALPLLLLAGSLAAEHRLPVAPLVLGSGLGFWVGDVVWYAFGWSQGRRVLGLPCSLSLNPDACVGRAERRFRRRPALDRRQLLSEQQGGEEEQDPDLAVHLIQSRIID